MKKNWFFLFILAALTVGGIFSSVSPQTANALSTTNPGSPGDAAGFASGEPCGFLMGTAATAVGAPYAADAESMIDLKQGCADENGNFYATPIGRDSQIYIKSSTKTYTVDLVGKTTSGTNYQVNVDPLTGYWSGFGYITDASFPGANRWVWFDWSCSSSTGTSGGTTSYSSAASSCTRYQVKTDQTTGVVTGYAWNDSLTFISFRVITGASGMTMELAPKQIEVFVDVLASDSGLGSGAVDTATAPLADGHDFWRVRVQLWDPEGGSDGLGGFLDETDLSGVTFSIDLSGAVYLNQVENAGDALRLSALNSYYGCNDSTSRYCSMTEKADGSWSANYFIYSSSPTADMIGMNLNGDSAAEYSTDREGCRWLYYPQWKYLDGASARTACPGGDYEREDVFYDRTIGSRNMVGLEYIGLDFAFTDTKRDYEVLETSQLSYVSSAGGYWIYSPTPNYDYDGDGTDEVIALSFRPRFQVTDIAAVYDGEDHMSIPADLSISDLAWRVRATVASTSDFAQAASVLPYPLMSVYDQVSVTAPASPSYDDNYLLLDTDVDGTADCSYATDTSYGSAAYVQVTDLAYGQQDASCQGVAPSGAASNSISAPMAEQWVCDLISVSSPSCYYTAYLPIQDRYATAEDMLVIGAVNATLGVEDVVSEDYISVLGSTDTIQLRNKMYAQVVRYTLGRTATGGVLNSSMLPSTGTIVSLMNGRLLYANGDVHISGSSAFSNKTLVVVGGNVYIDGDITNGRLGVVAFRSNGVGGNVYVAPSVGELYANFFLDGALYSYDGSTAFTTEPTWSSSETREDTLRKQLYLNGSLVARNTVNGSADSDGDGYYDLGDGTKVTGLDQALEHDLNFLRSYSLCYPLDAAGIPDSSATPEECGEGTISSYGAAESIYSPFILDYAPADSLPIFNVQAGLFQ